MNFYVIVWCYCSLPQPLEGGSAGRQLQGEKPVKNVATVLYIGRIPHGFYEDQMEGNLTYPVVFTIWTWRIGLDIIWNE